MQFFYDYSFWKFSQLEYNGEYFELPFGSQTIKIPTMDVYIEIQLSLFVG